MTSAHSAIRSLQISASASMRLLRCGPTRALILGLFAREEEMLRALAALAMNQMELRLYAEKVTRLESTERSIGDQLRHANDRLVQSEERFRDFFEEAPIAYLVGSAAGIIQANRTAARLFGVKPEEMAELHWRSLFPDTPEAQRRLREALKLVESRPDASGSSLELRRKDDGRPVWIEWWSKREAGGKYVRV